MPWKFDDELIHIPNIVIVIVKNILTDLWKKKLFKTSVRKLVRHKRSLSKCYSFYNVHQRISVQETVNKLDDVKVYNTHLFYTTEKLHAQDHLITSLAAIKSSTNDFVRPTQSAVTNIW